MADNNAARGWENAPIRAREDWNDPRDFDSLGDDLSEVDRDCWSLEGFEVCSEPGGQERVLVDGPEEEYTFAHDLMLVETGACPWCGETEQ